MYYLLEEKGLDSTERLALVLSRAVVDGITSWLLGSRFTVEVPQPLVFTLDSQYPGRLPDYLKGSPPLFSNRLIKALQEAGVANLDTYAAALMQEDGTVASDDYRAVNVIGIVPVADVQASETANGGSPGLIDTSFDSLVVDESRCNGLLLFRLAAAVNGVVVHESVKKHLEARDLGSLGFIEPRHWMS